MPAATSRAAVAGRLATPPASDNRRGSVRLLLAAFAHYVLPHIVALGPTLRRLRQGHIAWLAVGVSWRVRWQVGAVPWRVRGARGSRTAWSASASHLWGYFAPSGAGRLVESFAMPRPGLTGPRRSASAIVLIALSTLSRPRGHGVLERRPSARAGKQVVAPRRRGAALGPRRDAGRPGHGQTAGSVAARRTGLLGL